MPKAYLHCKEMQMLKSVKGKAMRTFIEEETSLGVLPTFGIVTYHQKIHSQIRCKGRLEKQTLEREIKVEILPYNPMFFTVKIVTEKTILELDSTLKKQENLSKEIFGIIDTIEFRMNWRGELIEIVNHPEIINKWRILKPYLKEKYTGQAVERYLIGIDKKIVNHDKLLSDCLQYRLYGLLFNDMYGTHRNDIEYVNDRVRVLGNMVYQLPLTVREKVMLKEEDQKKVALHITGVLDKEQPYITKIQNLFKRKNIVNPEAVVLTRYHGAYTYNKKTALFDSISMNIITRYGLEYKKTQSYELKREES